MRATFSRVKVDRTVGNQQITKSLKIPHGTVANLPVRMQGNLLYNTATESIYYSDGVQWKEIASGNINNISGNLQVSGQALSTLNTLTFGTTVTTDLNTGNVHTITLTNNATLANPVNMQAGATYIWIIKQDSAGSRTMTFGTAFQFSFGQIPTLTATANAVDILTGVSDGTNIYVTLLNNFS